MKFIKADFLFPALALAVLTYAFSQQLFNAPPLGKVLDPFIGVIQNGNDDETFSSAMKIDRSGVKEKTTVFFDDRMVPHIFAKNEEDLYFTQGYVTASLRLWQMDFLSYASAGRLCEIFGKGMLSYDRKQRRVGILEGARQSLKVVEGDTTTGRALTAYTRGVNAYISQLNYKSMPLEYKLLNYKPEQWTNLKTVLISKYMASILSGTEQDYLMSNLMLALQETEFNKLFPAFAARSSPLINSGVRTDPSMAFLKKPAYLDYSFMTSNSILSENTYNSRLGSNSWVIGGQHTVSGNPILCNDPHLDLTLPAIWLEMQLSCPGINEYGVAIPGTPAVTIGFNRDIAWGITNGEDDVKDWYKLKMTSDLRKYYFNGQWLDLTTVIEPIFIKDDKTVYDTIYHTIQGPVVYDKSFSGSEPEIRYHALRWQLQQPSNEFRTFLLLAKAKDHADFKEAVRSYSCPSQNFTFAGRNHDIAAIHQGKMAVKWPGQGEFVLDGTLQEHLPARYIPEDSLPQQLNPSSGLIVSANQRPTDGSYPYFYNGYYTENRANRIRTLLDTAGKVDVARMERMLLDNTSDLAIEVLPQLVAAVEPSVLNTSDRATFDSLKRWNGAYDAAGKIAILYDLWWAKVRDMTWDEFSHFSFGYKLPDDGTLLALIRDHPSDSYFDLQSTAARESAPDIIRKAFPLALEEYRHMPGGRGDNWGQYHQVVIMHLLKLRELGYPAMPSAGNPEAINAINGTMGPSWRMVVELGDRPVGYGIYPGGQSGNIGSRYYNNFVEDWHNGQYYKLKYFLSHEEAKKGSGREFIFK